MKVKRGYKSGAKTLEILEGNVDVIMYNDKGDNFFFYRFRPEQVFSPDVAQTINRSTNVLFREDMEEFLQETGMQYEGLINELIERAVDSGMDERYDL